MCANTIIIKAFSQLNGDNGYKEASDNYRCDAEFSLKPPKGLKNRLNKNCLNEAAKETQVKTMRVKGMQVKGA